jgi:AcrR family transcriptional regulator
MTIDATPPTEAPGLRERTRRAVRTELTNVAMDLFTRQGYEGTTVDEIALAAGISRRSLFRYFASKEAIIFDNLEDVGEQLVVALAERPREEDVWTALRRTFDVLTAYNTSNPQRTLTFYRMLQETPALRGRHFEQQMRWQERLVPDITVRLVVEAGQRADGHGRTAGRRDARGPARGVLSTDKH